MKELRTFVTQWFAAVGLITLALVPIRLYLLTANDWLLGALSTLALAFLAIYFLMARFWKPTAIQPAP